MDAAGSRLNFAYALGFMFAIFLYGINFCLFLTSLVIIHRQKRLFTVLTVKVFYTLNILVFLSGSLYAGKTNFLLTVFQILNLTYAVLGFTWSQFIKAFVTGPDGPSAFLAYANAPLHWENMATRVLMTLMMAFFNGIMVYRCYLVWLGDIRAVLVQILLELSIIAFTIVSFVSFARPNILPYIVLHRIVEVNGPLHLTQSILNTSLIVYRLFRQHRNSTEAGLQSLGTSLLHTARIIIESAMIYTLLLLCLMTLNLSGNIFAYALQEMLVPVIGIVLNLIVVRGHLSRFTPSAETPSKVVLRDLEFTHSSSSK